MTPHPTPGRTFASEGTALVVIASGLFALVAPMPVQVFWLLAAAASAVLTARRQAVAEPHVA